VFRSLTIGLQDFLFILLFILEKYMIILNQFSKNRNFFMNSDGVKLYMKLVAFDEIYNLQFKLSHLKSSCGSNN
jgi:hypothetical protein